jgi:Peptidase of plants and bacteria
VARAAYGVNNAAVPWALAMGSHYTAGYQATAHFLEWVGAQYGGHIISALDTHLRTTGCPADSFWISYTSLGVEALWITYTDEARSAPTTLARMVAPGPGGSVASTSVRNCIPD